MYGIKELNTYFESIKEKEQPSEVITELQQAMAAMGQAIEQLAVLQAQQSITEEVKPEVEEVQEEVEEKEL